MKKIVLSFAALSLFSGLAISADVTTKDVNNDQGKPVLVKGKSKHHQHAKVTKYDDRTTILERQVSELNSEVSELKKTQYLRPTKETPWVQYFHQHGPMVVTSPVVPMVSREDGYDLYINMPSINEDLALLKSRQKMDDYYTKYGIVHDRPVVVLSGDLEGQVQYDRDYVDPTRITTTLASADFEVVGEINSWVNGLMLISFNNGAIDYVVGQISNLLYLNRGYLTFGNLNKFPLYFTIGQFYVPFGNYANYMITTPLTQIVGKTKERAILAGFQAGGFYGAIFGFNGMSFVSNDSTFNNGGANLGYTYTKDKFSVDFGISYLVNIADSEGMQKTPGVSYASLIGSRIFNGFGAQPDLDTEQLHHNVPAGDIHGFISYDPFVLLAEYVGTFQSFDSEDLAFNNEGAKISALDIEGVYNFNIYTKPSFLSAGYGRSWEALILNIPEQSFFVSLSSSLLRSTREAIEYRHDINYSPSDSASAPTFGFPNKPFSPEGRRNRDLITLSLKLFF